MPETNYSDYLEKLAQQESSGRWGAKNPKGFLGAFQMGEEALVEAGYYKRNPKHPENDGKNHWDGEWTGKNNVHSMEDYLKNHEAQVDAVTQRNEKQWKTLRRHGILKFIGKKINGIEITPSGLLAGAHLKPKALYEFLRSNGKIVDGDGNGTPVTKYVKEFGGFNTYEVTKIPTWEQYKKENNIQEPKYTPDNVVNNYNRNTPKNVENERNYYINKRKEFNDYVNDVINYGEKEAKKRRDKQTNNSTSSPNKKSVFTGFAAPTSSTNSISSNKQNNFDKKEPSKLMHIGGIAVDTDNVSIYGKKWNDLGDEDKKAFFEGLRTGAITKEGEKRAKLREKDWTKKFNIGNPETDKGHWITLDNGKHLFIKDR